MEVRLPFLFFSSNVPRPSVISKFPRNIRNFKRSRSEVPKFESEAAIETPFANVKLGKGSLPYGNLWRPFCFTVAVSNKTISLCLISSFIRHF